MTALYHNEKQLAVVNTVMIKVAQEVHDVDDDANDERFFVEETFTVPKEKIASVSPFFAAAFNGRFREAKHRCIQLRDTDIDTFREFLVWLEERGDREKPSVSDAHRYSQSDYPELGSMIANVTVKLYVFAHVYNVPRLRNDATDRLYGYFLLSDHDTGGFCITPESVDLVYEHTNDTSGIRNLLVAGYYNRYHPISFPEQDLKKYPAEFLADVLDSKTDGCISLHGRLSTYHDHEGGGSSRRM